MWCASSSAKLLTQLGLSGHGVNWPLSTPKMGAFDEQPVNAIKLDKIILVKKTGEYLFMVLTPKCIYKRYNNGV
jgi:hypothetical protein